jgi:hypothetical protein
VATELLEHPNAALPLYQTYARFLQHLVDVLVLHVSHLLHHLFQCLPILKLNVSECFRMEHAPNLVTNDSVDVGEPILEQQLGD